MNDSLSDDEIMKMHDRAVGTQITTVQKDVSVSSSLTMDDQERKYDDEEEKNNDDECMNNDVGNDDSSGINPTIQINDEKVDGKDDTPSTPIKETKHVRFASPVVDSIKEISPRENDYSSGISDIDIENEPEVIITLDHLYSAVSKKEKDIVDSMTEKESEYASLLCIPVKIDKQSAGYALIDQAASRSLIRRSHLDMIRTTHRMIPVKRHYVLSSSGKKIPIKNKVRVCIHSNNHAFGDVLLYIVEDTIEDDICCDVVIGRSTLAMSQYSHIDTTHGWIYNPNTKATIQCMPAL